MKGFYTILLLLVSNSFMTLAWYGQLRFRLFEGMALWMIVLLSWGIAFFEYACMIPANRIGFVGTGGPFSLMQLKVIQEVITLTVFVGFAALFFKGESFRLNHLWGAICLVMAVYFMFKE